MPLVEPDWLSALPVGHAWARLGGQYSKLKTPLLKPFDADLIERLGYGPLIETIRRAKEQERQHANVA